MYLFLVAKLSQTNKNISNNTLEDFSRKLEFSNAKNMNFQEKTRKSLFIGIAETIEKLYLCNRKKIGIKSNG